MKRAWYLLLLAVPCAAAVSCRNTRVTRPYLEPPPSYVKPTVIDYVEQDGFDALFESALVNQDAAILIQTQTSQPDWGPRLNAWIAAWNRGGKVSDALPRITRGQAPVTVNGETIREFRLLIDDLMKQVEDVARRGSSWYAEERTQRRRIALLKPYSLRFHLDENKKIQLIFFNGMYSKYYARFMEAMAVHDTEEPKEWSRDMKCSHCRRLAEADARPATRVRARNTE